MSDEIFAVQCWFTSTVTRYIIFHNWGTLRMWLEKKREKQWQTSFCHLPSTDLRCQCVFLSSLSVLPTFPPVKCMGGGLLAEQYDRCPFEENEYTSRLLIRIITVLEFFRLIIIVSKSTGWKYDLLILKPTLYCQSTVLRVCKYLYVSTVRRILIFGS